MEKINIIIDLFPDLSSSYPEIHKLLMNYKTKYQNKLEKYQTGRTDFQNQYDEKCRLVSMPGTSMSTFSTTILYQSGFSSSAVVASTEKTNLFKLTTTPTGKGSMVTGRYN